MNTYFSAFLLGFSLVTISLPPDLVLALPSSQSKRSPQSMIERVVTSNNLDSKWFNPIVFTKTPLPKLEETMDELRAIAKDEFGAYKSVQFIEGDKYRVLFERGAFQARISLDPNGSITSLTFENPEKF